MYAESAEGPAGVRPARRAAVCERQPTHRCAHTHSLSRIESDDSTLLIHHPIGHALNKITKDIINRSKLLQGYRIQSVATLGHPPIVPPH